MFDLIKNLYKSKVSEYKLKESESIMMSKFLDEQSDLVVDRSTDGGFTRMDQATDREKGHFQTDQLEMIRQARRQFRWEPNARGALQSMQNYIMGQGISITPKAKDPMLWWVWREFWTSNRSRMEIKQFEIIIRLFRDGEVFMEFFSEDAQDKSTGKTTVRFIDPLLVKNPASEMQGQVKGFNGQTTRSGIEHDSQDVETVVAYWVQSNADSSEFRKVPANRVLHIKIFSDSDQKRGESFIQPILNMLTNYRQWLDNRIILNKMRSAIVLIRQMKGTQGQVNSIVSNLAQAAHTRTGAQKRENFRGGTILTANEGVEYKMLAPNINATDVSEDGRNIKLNMAAGTNLPEYIYGDASNANFASSLIAESPFVKSIQYWQTFLEYYYCQIYKRVIKNAADAGLIEIPDEKEFFRKLKGVAKLTEQDDEDESPREKALKELMPEGKMESPMEIFFGCDIQWPEIIHRNVKEQTEALQLQRAAGWVSDPSASQKLGYEYSEEVRKQKQTEEIGKTSGNPLAGIKAEDEREEDDADDMDAEIQDMLKGMTPQQRQAVMSAQNPQEVAAAMAVSNGTQGPPQGGE